MNLKTLSVTQAATETGMPAAAIRRLLESGAVAGNRNGRKWHVSAASLEAWINRTAAPTPLPSITVSDPENPFL